MKIIATFLITAVLALLSFMAPTSSEHAEATVTAEESFFISVETEGNTVRLTCTQGCAWTELTWTCKEGEDCKNSVDFYGMQSR